MCVWKSYDSQCADLCPHHLSYPAFICDIWSPDHICFLFLQPKLQDIKNWLFFKLCISQKRVFLFWTVFVASHVELQKNRAALKVGTVKCSSCTLFEPGGQALNKALRDLRRCRARHCQNVATTLAFSRKSTTMLAVDTIFGRTPEDLEGLFNIL